MLEIIERLLILQERDQNLKALQGELKYLPTQKAAMERELEELASRLDFAKTRTRENEVERKKLELEAQTKRDAIAKYRTQQTQTRKNEEYTALGHEIVAAEKVIVDIEDREIVLMEELESLKPIVAAAEKAHAEEVAKVRSKIEEMARRKAQIEERIDEIQKNRARLAENIDEDVLDRYNRLFHSKGDAAISPLDHEVCGGCNMKVTTQTALNVKAGREIVSCPQCARILYAPGY